MTKYLGPETKGIFKTISCIPVKVTGKLAIVTGANRGLGKSISAELARRGADVIMACRDLARGQTAKDDLLDTYGVENSSNVNVDVADSKVAEILQPIYEEQLHLEQLDLSSFDSIRDFVSRIVKLGKPVDFLVNNAAVISQTYEKSTDDHELQFAVNYLGPVLLTELLMPTLQQAAEARIVNISSMLHFVGDLYKPSLHLVGSSYGPMVAYAQSKLALTMYTINLAERVAGTKVIPVALNPGIVKTSFGESSNTWSEKLFKTLMKPQEISPWEGAQTVLHALLRRSLVPGTYYEKYDRELPDFQAQSKAERKWLWDKTQEMIKLQGES